MSGSKARTHIARVIKMNNWSVLKAFEKATSNNNPNNLVCPVIRLYAEHEHIPMAAWEDALIKTANFVEQWGAKYLPLFERVEYELEKSRKQLRLLEKARSIAGRGFSTIDTPSRQQGYFIEPELLLL